MAYEKRQTRQTHIYIFFFRYINLSKNSSPKYYQKNKERLQKMARERYQNLSKEEKEKKQEYGHKDIKKSLSK